MKMRTRRQDSTRCLIDYGYRVLTGGTRGIGRGASAI